MGPMDLAIRGGQIATEGYNNIIYSYCLTHWALGDVKKEKSTLVQIICWSQLVRSGNKQLHEPFLTQIYVCHHVVSPCHNEIIQNPVGYIELHHPSSGNVLNIINSH